jgi:hypothetical protein
VEGQTVETADEGTAAGSIIRDRYVLAEPYDRGAEGPGSVWWAVDAVLHRTIVIAFDDPATAAGDQAVPAPDGPTTADDTTAPGSLPDDEPGSATGADETTGPVTVLGHGDPPLAAASLPTLGARARAGLGDVLDGGWHDGAFYRVYRLAFTVEGDPAVPAGVLAAVRAADDGPRSAWAVAAAVTGDAPAPAPAPAGLRPAAPEPIDDVTAVLARPATPATAPWTADIDWMTAAQAHHAPPQPEDPTVEVPLPAAGINGGRPTPHPAAAAGVTASPDPTAILPLPVPVRARPRRPVRTTGPRPPIARPRRAPAPDAATATAAAAVRPNYVRTVQTLVPMAVVVAVVLVGVVVFRPSRDPQVGTPAVAAGPPTLPPTTVAAPVVTEPPAPIETSTTVAVTRPRPTTTTTVEETTTTAAPTTTTKARATTSSSRATTTTTTRAGAPRGSRTTTADTEDGGDGETAAP